MSIVGSIEYDARINTSQFDSDANKVEKRASSMGTNIDTQGSKSFRNFASNVSSSFNSVADSILQVTKVATGLFATGAFGVSKFVNLAGDLQNANQSMNALFGSAEDANKAFGQLYNYTLGKPIAFPTAIQAAKTLAGYGIASDKVVDSMKDLSAISIVTGGDLSSLALAYGQVNSRGKLMGQETLQLVNQSVPIVKILAAHFHKNLTDMANDMQGGAVSAEDFNAAIHEYVGGIDITKFSDTFKNRMISLQGSIRSVGLAIIGVRVDSEKGLIIDKGGLFDKLSTKIMDFGKWLKDHKTDIVNFANVIINNLVPALAGLAAAFTVAKVAAIAFDIAANANPIGIVVAAITLLVGAITFLQVKFHLFSNAFDFLKDKAQPIVDMFKSQLLPILQQIWRIVQGQLIIAWYQLKDAFDQIKTALAPFMPQLEFVAKILAGGVLIGLLGVIVTISALVVVVARVIGLFAEFEAWLTNLTTSVYSFSASLLGGLINALGSVIYWFMLLPGRISDALGNLGSTLYNAGRDLINGLVNGIKDSIGAVTRAVGDAANSVKDKFRSILGIHSPSKVFAGYGKNIVEGLNQGMAGARSTLDSSMSTMTGQLQIALPNMSGIPSQQESYQGGGKTINQYNTINNPQDMTKALNDLDWKIRN